MCGWISFFVQIFSVKKSFRENNFSENGGFLGYSEHEILVFRVQTRGIESSDLRE